MKSILNQKSKVEYEEEGPKATKVVRPEVLRPKKEAAPEAPIQIPEVPKSKLTLDTAKDVCSRVYAELKPHADRRDEARVVLGRLEKSLAEYVEQKQKLESSLAEIVKAGTAAMMEGKPRPDNAKEVGRLKAELADVSAWVEELNAIACPKARVALSDAQYALDHNLGAVVYPLVQEFKEKVFGHVNAALDTVQGYVDGINEMAAMSGVQLFTDIPGKSDGGIAPLFFIASRLKKVIEGGEIDG